MSETYGYLKKYIPGGSGSNDNWFYSVDEAEILEAEKMLGFSFPEQLRNFYQSVGSGMLRSPHNPPKDYEFYSKNEILPPMVVAHFYQGILKYFQEPFEDPLEYDEEYYLANYIIDIFEPGDLPFFEIGDSSSFMIMKTKSNNPNAVWYMGHEKIEDSFEVFIKNLYFKNPNYYTENF